MHKILLIVPPLIKNKIAFTREGRCQERAEVLGSIKPPLTLAYLAAILEKNKISFRVIDATAERLTIEKCILRLDNFSPDIIIFPSTSPTIEEDTSNIARLKRKFRAKILTFGPHSTAIPMETMKKLPELDGVILHDVEETVVELCQTLFEDYEKIKGIYWRKNKKIVNTPPRGFIKDLDRLPYPAWEYLPLNKYQMPILGKPYLLVETSRGCPFNCNFCVVPIIHGLNFRQRKPIKVANEIEYMKKKFKIETFYLWGDTVTLEEKFILNLSNEIIARKLNIKWIANARLDTINNILILKKMKKAGLWMLGLGVESVSEHTRGSMNKKLDRGVIETGFKNLKKVGIKSYAFFILGYPGETIQDMQKTIDFALKLDPDFVSFYPAIPYPGTPFYANCQEKGLIKNDRWDRLEYSHYVLECKKIDEDLILKMKSAGYRRFYIRLKFVWRTIKSFPSSSALAKTLKNSLDFFSWRF